MPRVAGFRTAAIDELCRQLRFAPRETRAREMDAAERLAWDLDPERNYPHDFVIYRITGYRPDRTDEAVTLVGAALLADLVTFVQRLSADLDLPADHGGRRAVPLEEVARRLRVSTKTIQRYRRRGLVCHYVRGEDGEPRLSCFDDAVERFVRRHRARVLRAGGFTRVAESTERAVIDAARELRAQSDVSLNDAALRIARRHGRSHETIRGILQRHDRRAETPIFGGRGPLGDRDARLIHRAWRRGIPAATLARRLGRTAGTIRRVLNRRRCELLRRLDIRWVELPTFDLEDAAGVILAAPAVAGDLDDTLLPRRDAIELLEAAARARREPAPDDEAALAAGYNFLKRRARRGIDALPRWPASALLNGIEADLRRATRLKRRLVSLALPHALLRIEQNLHRPLGSEPAERIVGAIALARSVCARAAETLDPARGQRLERLVSYATDRALARPQGGSPGAPAATPAAPARRASARHEPGSIPIPDPFDAITPWEPLV